MVNDLTAKKRKGIRRSTRTETPPKSRGILSLQKITVPADQYAVDLELHDRFLQFSGELMRTALGGVAAIGAVVTLLIEHTPYENIIRNPYVSVPLIGSIAAFSFAAGASLHHRFLAADGMVRHIRAVKLLNIRDSPVDFPSLTDRRSELEREVEEDEAWRNAKFKTSERMLFVSGALLFGGVLSFGIAIVAALVLIHK